jgi:hypothetical protein
MGNTKPQDAVSTKVRAALELLGWDTPTDQIIAAVGEAAFAKIKTPARAYVGACRHGYRPRYLPMELEPKKIKYVAGDLFGPIQASTAMETIVIPHVVNDRGAFGAGFVVRLAQAFPKAKQDYLDWSAGKIADEVMPFKLGLTFFSEVIIKHEPPIVFVAHMLAQTLGGRRPLFYNHLSRCMDSVADFALGQSNPKIVAPMFGSDLAGGNWSFIEELITDCWLKRNLDVTIHYLPGRTPQGWTPPTPPGEP